MRIAASGPLMRDPEGGNTAGRERCDFGGCREAVVIGIVPESEACPVSIGRRHGAVCIGVEFRQCLESMARRSSRAQRRVISEQLAPIVGRSVTISVVEKKSDRPIARPRDAVMSPSASMSKSTPLVTSVNT